MAVTFIIGGSRCILPNPRSAACNQHIEKVHNIDIH